MEIAMTTRARRERHASGVLQIVHTMRTPGLPAGHASMTFPTVNRVEPALVLAVVGADVAVEAIRVAVRARRKVSQIDLMAVVAVVFPLGADRLKYEQQAGNQDG
jgi:hypothetical protein